MYSDCKWADTYDPSMPRVYKYNPVSKSIAGDTKDFIDDFQRIGANSDQATLLSHQHRPKIQYLGIQNAPHKQHPVTKKSGTWTSLITAIMPGVRCFVNTM